MDGPVLPFDFAAVHGEGHAFGLADVDRFQVSAVAEFLTDRVGVVVIRRGLVQGSSDRRHVDMDDFLQVAVVYRAEIQRVGVLRIIHVWTVVHQGLLQAHSVAEALVVADGPWVAVDFVHVRGRDAEETALLDHARVLATDVLDDLQVFHGDQRLDVGRVLPLNDFGFVEVDETVHEFAVGCDGDHIGDSRGASGVV